MLVWFRLYFNIVALTTYIFHEINLDVIIQLHQLKSFTSENSENYENSEKQFWQRSQDLDGDIDVANKPNKPVLMLTIQVSGSKWLKDCWFWHGLLIRRFWENMLSSRIAIQA